MSWLYLLLKDHFTDNRELQRSFFCVKVTICLHFYAIPINWEALILFCFISTGFHSVDCCLYLDCVSLFSFVLMVLAIPRQVNMSSTDLFPTIWFYSLFHFICFHFNYLSTGWKIAAW